MMEKNDFGEALEILPFSPEAHFNLGNAFSADGNLAKALECYEKAISYNPTY